LPGFLFKAATEPDGETAPADRYWAFLPAGIDSIPPFFVPLSEQNPKGGKTYRTPSQNQR
jgi:hypothetical protein